MWKTEHSVEVQASPAQIWPYYADVGKWSAWYEDLLEISLDGPFTSGSSGVLKNDPAAGHHPAPVSFTLLDVIEQRSWSIDLRIANPETGQTDHVQMRSGAELVPAEDGTTQVTHWTEVSGPMAEYVAQNVGSNISESVSGGLTRLAAAVSE